MSIKDTKSEVERTAIVEDYIKNLQWSETTDDYARTLVAGNLRGFWGIVCENEKVCVVPDKDMDELGIPMHDTVHNAVHKVYFRAGVLAARESLARFVESENAAIAQSIRLNWWPSLGVDPGQPRQLNFDEIAVEKPSGGWAHADCDPSLEALPLAYAFLVAR